MAKRTTTKAAAKPTKAVAAKNVFNYGPTYEARRLPRRVYYKPKREWIVLGGVHLFESKSRGKLSFREATPQEYYELRERFPQFIQQL